MKRNVVKNGTKDVVLKEVIEGLKKGSKWHHRFIINIFKNLFYYAYRKGVGDCFKYYNK